MYKYFMTFFAITGFICYAGDFSSTKIPPQIQYEGFYPIEMNYDSFLQFRYNLINSKIKIGDKYDKVLNKLGPPIQLNWLYNNIKSSDNSHPGGFGIQYIYYQKSKVCASKDKKYCYIMFDLQGKVTEISDSYHPVANNMYDFENFDIGKKNIYVIFEVKNIFSATIHLKKIRTSCTCADVKYLKSELQPGESTELIVTLKANSLSGPFTHTIYVETDNPKQRFMRFVIKGNAIPLLKVSPDPVQYIGTLQVGKTHEYKYELVPTNPKEKISLELNHPKLPDGTDIKLEKQEGKFLLTVLVTPRKDQKSISLNFAVKIREPKDWADIKFTLNGRIQNSQSEQPAPEKTTP